MKILLNKLSNLYIIFIKDILKIIISERKIWIHEIQISDIHNVILKISTLPNSYYTLFPFSPKL